MTTVPVIYVSLVLLVVTACFSKETCEAIHCVSWNFSYVQYEAPQYISNIRLLQQDSVSNCIYGKSFGSFGRYIWVDKGCRGTFEVCYGGPQKQHRLHRYFQ